MDALIRVQDFIKFFILWSVYTPDENYEVKLSNKTKKVFLTPALAGDLCEEHLRLI